MFKSVVVQKGSTLNTKPLQCTATGVCGHPIPQKNNTPAAQTTDVRDKQKKHRSYESFRGNHELARRSFIEARRHCKSPNISP